MNPWRQMQKKSVSSSMLTHGTALLTHGRASHGLEPGLGGRVVAVAAVKGTWEQKKGYISKIDY